MTTHLIPVFTAIVADEPAQLCNARELHATLQVGRDFATWLKDRIEQYGFVEGEDFILCSPNPGSKKGRGGHNRTDYHLTLDMAKELAMVENNEIGRQIRRYLIQLEKKAIAAGLKVDAIINRAQTGELAALLAERFPTGKDRPYAWSRFNNHFRLASYKDLPAEKFEEACAYIKQMPVKAQAALESPRPASGEYLPAGEPVAVDTGNDAEMTELAMRALSAPGVRFVTQFFRSADGSLRPSLSAMSRSADVFKPADVVEEIATNRMGFFPEHLVKDLLWAISCRMNPARMVPDPA